MTIDELFYNYDNDEDFRKNIKVSLLEEKSKYSDEELIEHCNDINELENSFLLNSITNEIYPTRLEIKIS